MWAADQLADLADNGVVSRSVSRLDTKIPVGPKVIDNPGDEARQTPFVHLLQSQGFGLLTTAISQMGALEPESDVVRHWAGVLTVQMPRGLARMAVSAWINEYYAGKRFKPSAALLKLRDLLPPQ